MLGNLSANARIREKLKSKLWDYEVSIVQQRVLPKRQMSSLSEAGLVSPEIGNPVKSSTLPAKFWRRNWRDSRESLLTTKPDFGWSRSKKGLASVSAPPLSPEQ